MTDDGPMGTLAVMFAVMASVGEARWVVDAMRKSEARREEGYCHGV